MYPTCAKGESGANYKNSEVVEKTPEQLKIEEAALLGRQVPFK